MKIFLEKYYKYLVFFVAMFIPFIYSFFYLKAYWDPYGNLEDLNVAIVNLDKEKTHSIDFIDSLKKSDTCNFKVVNQNIANNGLIDGKYYAVITIPSDFSSNLDKAKTKDRSKTTLTYSANQKSNFLASQILNSVVNSAESSLNYDIDSKLVKGLSSSIEEMPENLQKIVDASNTLKDGSSKLNDGVDTLKNGTNVLSSGTKTLSDNLKTASDGSKRLASGTNDLNGGLNKIKEGSKSLKNGANSLNEGIKRVDTSTDTLMQNYEAFNNGISSFNDNFGSLVNGISSLKQGSEGLKQGVNNYTDNTKNLVTLINTCEIAKDENGQIKLDTEYNNNLKQTYGIDCNNIKVLSQALSNDQTINSLKGGASSLDAGIEASKNGANTLYAGSNELKDNSSKINEGIKSLRNGISSLLKGSSSLTNGTKDIDNALEQTKDGAQKINDSTSTLSDGLDTLSKGSNSLLDGANKLSKGVYSLKDGTDKLDNGIDEFKDKITSSKNETKEKVKDLKGIDAYSKKPLTIKKKPYAKVNTYGESFVPLFLSIGLWVGALLSYLVFYYDRAKKFKHLDVKNASLKQDLLYYGVSLIYGFLTAFLLKAFLGLNVTNPALYYVGSMLISLTFMSIVQFFIRSFGDIGKFLALVVLILQLTAAGGTFPIETVTKGFRVFNPLLPMTYSIKLIKESIFKLDSNFALRNILILILFIAVSFALNRIVCYIKNKKCSHI